MNTRRFTAGCFFAALLTLVPPSVAKAQDTGTAPQLPSSPFSRLMSGLNPANWKMPQMKMPSMGGILPSKEEKKRVITKKNSFVDEVSTTAKRSWNRTKSTLNPKRLIPAGFRTNSETTPAPKEKKEGSFLSWLFAPYPEREEVPESDTVTDFLKQKPIR